MLTLGWTQFLGANCTLLSVHAIHPREYLHADTVGSTSTLWSNHLLISKQVQYWEYLPHLRASPIPNTRLHAVDAIGQVFKRPSPTMPLRHPQVLGIHRKSPLHPLHLCRAGPADADHSSVTGPEGGICSGWLFMLSFFHTGQIWGQQTLHTPALIRGTDQMDDF